jgi:hypothetical protein
MAKDKKKQDPKNKKPAEKGKEIKKVEKRPAPSGPVPGEGGACSACAGKLVDYDDYVFYQRLRRAAACIPAAVCLTIVWAVLFAVIRTIIGGKLFSSGFGGFALLIGQKILVGAILGTILGVIAGIWRTDVGLFLGVVAGAIGGFFVAYAPMMPLLSDAAHRIDIVIAAVGGGILAGATVVKAYSAGTKRYSKYIGPDAATDKPAQT